MHCVLRIKHTSEMRLGYDKFHDLAKTFYNNQLEYPQSKYRILPQDKMYCNFRYLPSSDWWDTILRYIYKGMLFGAECNERWVNELMADDVSVSSSTFDANFDANFALALNQFK